MSYVKKIGFFAVISCTALSLASCSTLSTRRAKYVENGTVLPRIIVPKGASAPHILDYYALPKLPAKTKASTEVSLIPPGSRILQYRHELKAEKHHKASSLARLSAAGKNRPKLILAMPEMQAWSQVGRALAKTPYQILDKDNLLGSYYVLDTTSTHHKVNNKTPIFQVKISPQGVRSKIQLYNQYQKPANIAVAKRILLAIKQNLKT